MHGNIIGFIDADGSTDPQNYEKVLRALLSGNLDGAVASRYLPDSEMPIKQPFYRKFLSRGWNLLVRILFQIPFTDTQCGAKIFSAKALHSVARKIQTHGFEFDVEILWRLHKEGFAIKEVPITWVDKAHSTFRLLDIIGMFFRLLKVRCS